MRIGELLIDDLTNKYLGALDARDYLSPDDVKNEL